MARSSISATTSATASSTRCGSTARSRPASRPRAERSSGNYTVFQSGVYTACEPCKDDPRKPPKWQVKAARIIHDQGEKMMYFEDAQLEFFGMPLAYLPVLLGARSDRQAQDRLAGADLQDEHGLRHAVSVAVLLGARAQLRLHLHADDHHQAGSAAAGRMAPSAGQRLLQHPRHRHLPARQGRVSDGHDAGLSRLPRQHRDVRPVQSDGEVDLGLGRHADFGQDLLPGLRALQRPHNGQPAASRRRTTRCRSSTSSDAATAATSMRTMYFYGFSPADDQRQIPIIHPVMDYDYIFKNPIFGGELSCRSNLTSLSRDSANFDPISQGRRHRQPVRSDDGRPRRQEYHQLPAARRARHLHALVDRSDLEAHHHRSLRPDVHAVRQRARRRAPIDDDRSAAGRVELHHPRRHRSSAASCRRPASSTAIRSSACSPGAPRPSSRSRS